MKVIIVSLNLGGNLNRAVEYIIPSYLNYYIGGERCLLKLGKLSGKECPPNRRLKIFIGVFIVLLTYYVTTSTEPAGTASVSPVKQQVKQIKQSGLVNSKPVMPNGYQNEKVTRNPFALPPDMVAKNANKVSPSNLTPKNLPSDTPSVIQGSVLPKEALPSLRLTGIITSPDMRLAVIHSAGKSKSYQINDSLGTYKVAAISDDTVLLHGPSGPKVLNLDTVHKGEAKNAK